MLPNRFIAPLLCLLTLMPGVCATLQAANDLVEFQIKRQELATALLDYSYQSDVQVLMPGFLAEGLIAPAINGSYTRSAALNLLLANSGLKYSFTADRVVAISAEKKESSLVASHRRHLRDQMNLEQMFVVSAERRASVRDVTISMSALVGEDVESRGVTNADELQQFVPGLTVESPQSGNTEFSIRAAGISNDDVSTQSGVAVLLDDIYLPRQSVANMALYELDRVEVLRGPQSTMYARNATGGALLYTSRKPTSDFEARYALDVGENGLLNNQLTVNGQLTEKVSARVATATFRRDPIMDNLLAQEPDGNNVDSDAARIALRFESSKSVEWLLSVDGENTEQAAVLYSIGPEEPFQFTTGLQQVNQSHPTRSASVDGADKEKLDSRGLLLRADVKSKNYYANYIFGRRSHDVVGAYDLDQTSDFLVNKRFQESSDFRSFESRWMSPDKQGKLQQGQFDWLAGMLILNEDATVYKQFDAPGLAAGSNRWQQSLHDRSYSVYGQLEYGLSDRLQLVAGLRYVADFRDFGLTATTNVVSIQNPYIQQPFSFSDRQDWRRLTPKLALHYQHSPDTAYYASGSTGYKSGGFVGTAANFAEATSLFDHERVTSVETGIRTNWFAKRVKFNMAVYFSEFKDMQVMGNDEVGKSFVVTANKADVNGFEMELQARITAALKVSIGMSFVDAQFKDFVHWQNTIYGGKMMDKSGDAVPRIPDSTLNFSVVYLFSDTAVGSWSMRADAAYSDGAVDLNNNMAWTDYRTYNLWLDYLPHNGEWEVALWLRNLRDKVDFQTSSPGISASDSAFARKLSPPRMAGLSVKYYF